jgi:hypothetical protein
MIKSDFSNRRYFFTQLRGNEFYNFMKQFEELSYIRIGKYIAIHKDGIIKILDDKFKVLFEFDNNDENTQIHNIEIINDYIFVTRGNLYYHTIVYDKNMNIYFDFGKNRYVEPHGNSEILIVSNIRLKLREPYKDNVVESELISSKYFDFKNKVYIDDDGNAYNFCRWEGTIKDKYDSNIICFREFYDKIIVRQIQS